jgi:hypothetical protein
MGALVSEMRSTEVDDVEAGLDLRMVQLRCGADDVLSLELVDPFGGASPGGRRAHTSIGWWAMSCGSGALIAFDI